MRKIKIAYFELFHIGAFEDYSIYPKSWGGGPIFARWAKELWKDSQKYEFIIFAPRGCWEHINEERENKSCFIDIPIDICKHLLNGVNIKNFIPNIDYFDILLHGHTNIALNNLNCRGVQVHWSGFGRASDGHPFVPYTFVYGPDLTPFFKNQKTFAIKIGKPVSDFFIQNTKEDFIFQCSRHDFSYDSIQIIKECNKNNIKGFFAGKIDKDYPLLKNIDNKNTFYLGEISEEIKLDYSRKACGATFITPFGCAFNQSVIECLGFGTPIIYKKIKPTFDPTFRDWLKEIIIDNYNGVCYDGNNFLDCFNRLKKIEQKNCWLTAKQYSTEEMIRSFENGIDFVINDSKIFL